MSKMQESEEFLKQTTVVIGHSFSFEHNTDIEQYLSEQVGLGKILQETQSLPLHADPNHVFTVLQANQYDVSLPSDSQQKTQYITSICIIDNDKIILTDNGLKRVKLLDQHYKVISHLDMHLSEGGMCQISTNEVVLALIEWSTHMLHFICVNNGQLVKGNKLKLQHKCSGIAYHSGNLFVNSRTALKQYNMSGELLKSLFEDTTGSATVFKCAVSLPGDRIYVTNHIHSKLLTLATDGTIISSFTDPELRNPYGVHVTTAGQVLVCGCSSASILQVDKEGKKKLATLKSKKYGMFEPVSVCYDSKTNSVIVGQQHSTKNILVLKVK
ncbi:uncharacterized protein LOC127854459 [Dreissena polymorpha]|uniref:Uncharacterized protein n=1 Tax=Dreissena polymorpha TaxID=45954 RepID=A0A9D4HLL8_DREPO|nr:uncharacterized protein LOC127854459 [Dreissena polymorpha]XP_052245464.1 uncharacterized protein LOC127854459 [Dreissena polymorpha]KAH3722028.1 hypothetical protein DPMN_064977 [Dreissena polymorpha]